MIGQLILEVLSLLVDEIRHAQAENQTETLERIRTELHRAKSHRAKTDEAIDAEAARLREDVP
jgi:hypothetical protein